MKLINQWISQQWGRVSITGLYFSKLGSRVRRTGLVAGVFVLGLMGCGSNSDDPEVFQPPFVSIDFPANFFSSAFFACSPIYGTTDDNLNLYGVALGLSSNVTDVSVNVLHDDESTKTADLIYDAAMGFDWEYTDTLTLVRNLELGRNVITVTATDSNQSGSERICPVRGSSWMLERGLQVEDGVLLALDVVRQQIISIDIETGMKADEVDLIAFDLTTVDGPMRLIPEDMAIISADPAAMPPTDATAYIIDRNLNAVLEANLATDVVISVSSPPSAITFIDPVAIAIDEASKIAYVLDRGLNDIVRVNLTTGVRSMVIDNTMGDVVVFDEPKDLIFQASENVLYLADQGLKAVVLIDLGDGTRRILSSDTVPAESTPASAVGEVQSVGEVKSLALMGDRLFALSVSSVGGIGNTASQIVEVETRPTNTMPVITQGEATLVSSSFELGAFVDIVNNLRGGLPDANNPFRNPSSLAVGNVTVDMELRDILFVTDNILGNTLSLDLEPDLSIVFGSREYIAGGATSELIGVGEDFNSDFAARSAVDFDNVSGLILVGGELNSAAANVDGFLMIDQNTGLTDIEVSMPQILAPKAFSYDSVDDQFFVVDAASDDVIRFLSLTEEGDIISDNSSAVTLASPIDSVLIGEKLYVLDGALNQIVAVDVPLSSEESPPENGTRSVFPGTFVDPVAIVQDPNDSDIVWVADNGADNGVGNPVGGMISVRVSTEAVVPPTIPYPAGTLEVVDMVTDNRIEDDAKILVLDRGRSAIFTVSISAGMLMVDGDLISPTITGNDFVSATHLALDEAENRLYVLDDIINSVFVIDVRDRDGDDVPDDIQRLVFSRGASFNRM